MVVQQLSSKAFSARRHRCSSTLFHITGERKSSGATGSGLENLLGLVQGCSVILSNGILLQLSTHIMDFNNEVHSAVKRDGTLYFPCMMASCISLQLLPLKGNLPLTNTKRTTPNDQQSSSGPIYN